MSNISFLEMSKERYLVLNFWWRTRTIMILCNALLYRTPPYALRHITHFLLNIIDGDDDDLPQNAAGQEHRIKHRALQQRLRECQITMHRVRFLQGDVHHSLGRTEEENASYAAAEELRRILLQSRLYSLSIVKGFILIHVCRRRYGACSEACNATDSAGSY